MVQKRVFDNHPINIGIVFLVRVLLLCVSQRDFDKSSFVLQTKKFGFDYSHFARGVDKTCRGVKVLGIGI